MTARDDIHRRPLSSDTPWQARVHSGHQHARRRLVAALLDRADAEVDQYDLDTPHPARKLANRLTACCWHPAILQDDQTGELLTSSDSCNSRLCPRCGHRRARELRQCVDAHARELDSPAMVTLTIRADDMTLSAAIDHLHSSFRRLRRRKDWQAHCKGGIAVLEVTWAEQRQAWHPHLHVLADWTYWQQRALSDAWEACTGDSRIVDVRRVSGPAEAAAYVAKYVSKTQDATRLPSHRIPEWALAMHGRRLAQPFGRSHGTRTRVHRPERPGRLEQIGLLPILDEAAQTGDETAHEYLRAILHRPKLDAPDALPLDPGESAIADRDLADGIRDWFRSYQGDDYGDPARRSDAGPRPDRAHHRTERLWQDDDAEPTPGCDGRHPDSPSLPG